MQREIDEVTVQIGATKAMEGKKWSLKQMEIFRHNLQTRFDNLYNAEKKDDTIIFEELGVDNLFVDESHTYKNNFSYTKMQRVAGVGGKNSQRAMDMHMKCQYINEITKEHVLLLLIGLLEIQFVPALLGLVLVPLPFLAAALFKEGSMGGADIKLMAACGFIMGVQKGYMAMIAGLTLAVMIQKVYVRESEKGFALVPYLSIGCLLAMLL